MLIRIKEVFIMKLNELLAYALYNTIVLVKDNKSKKTIAYGEAQVVI